LPESSHSFTNSAQAQLDPFYLTAVWANLSLAGPDMLLYARVIASTCGPAGCMPGTRSDGITAPHPNLLTQFN